MWLQRTARGAEEGAAEAAHSAKRALQEAIEEAEEFLTADLSPHTPEEAALQSGGTVYVHCAAGISRSSAVRLLGF